MILRFRFQNFRSFRLESEISLLATRLDGDVAMQARVSAETDDQVSALPLVAILGANASGKSNLIRAFEFMRAFVLRSAYPRISGLGPMRDPFALDDMDSSRPSLFELDFIIDRNRDVYGFELADDKVLAEWLHTFPHRRAQMLFDRDEAEFSFGRGLPGPNRRIVDLTRPDALFLSTAANANHPALGRILGWFVNGLIPVKLGDPIFEGELASQIRGREARIGRLLRLADLGITGVKVRRRTMPEEELRALRESLAERLPDDLGDREGHLDMLLDSVSRRNETVRLTHRGPAGRVDLPLEEESLGTQTWLRMLVVVLDALQVGSAVIADELDANLHPGLMREIIRLFTDRDVNRNGAQLVFTTHDTWSLGTKAGEPLSRGQVWFVEKDSTGASALIPLSEYRPRKGEDLEKGYLTGRYGGVPLTESDSIALEATPTEIRQV